MPSKYYLNNSETEPSDESIYNVSSRQHLAYADGQDESKHSTEEVKIVEIGDNNKKAFLSTCAGICKFSRISSLRQILLALFTPLLLLPLLLSNFPVSSSKCCLFVVFILLEITIYSYSTN